MRRILLLAALIGVTFFSQAQRSELVDTLSSVTVTAIKQSMDLSKAPASVSVIGSKKIEEERITSLRDASTLTPNLHIPDYGSHITSSIYVRGLGARIDQPVMGLNVDNVPMFNKNAFDSDIMDIVRIEILRGPQSTLYGRNTMGGVVNIYTLSPFNFQGIKGGISYASGGEVKTHASLYDRISDKLAFSVGGYYNYKSGLFTNAYDNEKLDWERSGGGRLRVQFFPKKETSIDNTFSFSTLKEGGYPYKQIDSDEISYNDPSSYERNMVHNALTVTHRHDKWRASSITSLQYLDDAMTLDQDFSPDSFFIMTQSTKEFSASEDIVASSRFNGPYNAKFGLFGFVQLRDITAPVTFQEDGTSDIISSMIEAGMPASFSPAFVGDSFVVGSDFKYNTYGGAIYHESTLEAGRFTAKIGARLDYEKSSLDYHSYSSTALSMTNPYTGMTTETPIDTDIQGKPSKSYLEFLPSMSISYEFGANSSLYTTVAKGYKAGGFNTQIFSDIVRDEMMAYTSGGAYTPEDIKSMITYKPEYSWNYEAGVHLISKDRKLRADVSVFYIDTRDQQLTVFLDATSTGRTMTNAGHSRSWGVEASAGAMLGDFELNGSYGYTNAKFIDYNDNQSDYSGNYVPYSPTNTAWFSAAYNIQISDSCILNNIRLECNSRGVGEIYWNEENTRKQPYYTLLGGEVKFAFNNFNVAVWGKNLLDKEYNTFYFMSYGNEYVQQGNPRMFGVSLDFTL
ncbi:MAG: TonB-dependent receptor [Rikenellaceae bacterium]